ncbi:MAG: DMT family transporter [Methylobacteriaceae bacterium]|nr:DMT family transporter [Methylobacteriaceae bacterium]
MIAPPGPAEAQRAGVGRAIVAVLISMACFSVGDTVMKFATARMPVGEMITIRSVFAIGLALAVALHFGAGLSGAGLRHPVFWLRAVLEAAVTALFVSLLGKLTLGDMTTLAQMIPILMTAFAAVFLREAVGWRRWAATLTGFAGVVVVARPGAEGLNVWALAALFCAALVAARDLLTRQLPPQIRAGTVSVASSVAALAAGLGLGLFETWRAPTGAEIALAALAAAMTTGGNLGLIVAMRAADVSLVAPFRYSVIPFAFLAGFLVFDERPDAYGLIGIALIVGSGLYTLHRERVRSRERREAARPVGPPPSP